MAISYPLTLPSSPAPRSVQLFARDVVGVNRSPFTLQEETYVHAGQAWEALVTLPPLPDRADAEEWICFLVSLKGQRGWFRMGDPKGATPRGTATGTPVVDGGSQTGASLATRGWTAGVTGILKKGDYLQVGDHLYKNLTDADSDGSGEATLDIWPDLRSSPSDGASITVSSATGIWRLQSNLRDWQEEVDAGYAISFAAVTAIETS